MADKKEMEIALTETKVMEWVSKGHTRQYCMKKLQDEGMSWGAANSIYYSSLKAMLPNPDLFTDYKQTLMQQNIDRLEKIVESSISGSTADKALAIKAIDTLNKMVSAYGENGVIINKNKEGDEQIIIRFEK